MKAMVSLCRDLHLSMVVEGVETAAQRDALVSLGCTRGQGFFFFPPMSGDEVERQLHRQQSLASYTG
jgi:EAL domain-containing protein (putative c-di-GMP-specific phosphodiesterase class I)